jgi:hypothetical protein
VIKSLDAPKSILETEKKPKNSLFWPNILKKIKNKNKKKPLGGFFLNRVFSNPAFMPSGENLLCQSA